MTPTSLSFRLIAGAAIWCVLALAAGGLVLSQLFRDYAEGNFHTSLAGHLDILIRGSERDSLTGAFVLQDRPNDPGFNRAYSGLYWQISADGEAFATSRSLFDRVVALPAPVEPGGAVRLESTGPYDNPLMVVAQTVLIDRGAERFTFLVAGERQKIDAEINRFNQVLLWSAILMALSLVGAMLIQVRFGLRPLRQVRQGLEQIRAGRADRLDGRFPDEIKELVDEVNILIDHNATILDRARTQVGNLAHALKTPLAVLRNDADNLETPTRQQMRRHLDAMRNHIDHYLARARTAASGNLLHARTPAMPAMEQMARALRKIHGEKNIAINVSGDRQATFKGEKEDLDELLGNLMDNACKWARSTVWAAVERDSGNLVLRISDDGPGLDEDAKRHVLQRGVRLDETKPGTGLGLSIVADIADLYGGRIDLANRTDTPGETAATGLVVTISLPAAEPNEDRGIM